MASPVVQFQILSKAPDETAPFYSALFGWTVEAGNSMGYRRINTGLAAGIQGGIWPAPPQTSSFVQLFIAVGDVSAAAMKAQEMGAKIVVPAAKLPDGDEMAVLLDPQGLSFAVCEVAKR
jgi:predicted enzyme related to lactoylglutathione lyase